MKQALSSVFKTRSTLIATHLCVCSLSVGVTLTLLNIHLIVVLVCFIVATMCAGSIVKDVNKQYWSKKHLVFYVKRKNGKIHIERSKMEGVDQEDNGKWVWIRSAQHPFEHESDTVSKDAARNDEYKDEKSLGASLQEQVEREGIEMKQQNSTKGKDQPKW
jgi:hypothetical protein